MGQVTAARKKYARRGDIGIAYQAMGGAARRLARRLKLAILEILYCS
jgi:hypothetical protein